jgi:hypothetical protein
MGCFSYKCIECDKGVKSNSFSGEMVKIYLLDKGKVIQMMEGQYDSYGRVFIEGTQRSDVTHRLPESQQWEMGWDKVCNLLFSGKSDTGFAYVHTKCFVETPTRVSEDDPNQGWGDPDDGEEDLFGNIDPDHKYD